MMLLEAFRRFLARPLRSDATSPRRVDSSKTLAVKYMCEAGELSAFSLDAFYRGAPAHHTYVVSSCGTSFGCHGRSDGGSKVLGPTGGDIGKARWLAQPDGKAGIKYLSNGMCHQAANRILYAANSELPAEDIAAYRYTILVFGSYGKDSNTGKYHHPEKHPWPELQTWMSAFKNQSNSN